MHFTKKILPLLAISLLIFSVNFSIGVGGSNGTRYIREHSKAPEPPRVSDAEDVENIHDGSKTLSDRLKGIISVDKPENYDTSLGYVIALIKIAVNRALGILSFVTLIYMLYCGVLIFTSGAEDNNAKKGKKGIKTAAIALAGIGLSWLIISAIIWLITIVTKTKN